MRVLHLDSGREMRGGQWQVLRLLEGLGGTLLCSNASPLLEKAAQRGLDARRLSLGALARLAREADLIHAHDARSHACALAFSRPVVVSRRVAFPLRSSLISRWKYSRAAHYIAVSEFVKQELLRSGVPAAKISVVYDGVPIPEAKAGGDRIIAPATDDMQKGTRLACEAAQAAGVPLHFSRDLEADLAGARLFLYVTQSEGLGSAVLLAMAAGVPVVASRVGGLPEVIEDGRTGLLAENTPPALAASIHRLLDDPALAGEMAARARSTIAERFTVDRMVHGTMRVYRGLGV